MKQLEQAQQQAVKANQRIKSFLTSIDVMAAHLPEIIEAYEDLNKSIETMIEVLEQNKADIQTMQDDVKGTSFEGMIEKMISEIDQDIKNLKGTITENEIKSKLLKLGESLR